MKRQLEDKKKHEPKKGAILEVVTSMVKSLSKFIYFCIELRMHCKYVSRRIVKYFLFKVSGAVSDWKITFEAKV